jgi:hypothetical protein
MLRLGRVVDLDWGPSLAPPRISRKAGAESIEHGRASGVIQIQRYGSALNANTHFHTLVLDGVYTAPDALSVPTFHSAARITSIEVAKLLFTVRSRVPRLCRRWGLMGEEDELAPPSSLSLKDSYLSSAPHRSRPFSAWFGARSRSTATASPC